MRNLTFNPMHPGNRHFHDDRSPFARAFAQSWPPASAPNGSFDFNDSDAAQGQLLNDALAIGHAPSIAAALGFVAKVRGDIRAAA